MNTEIKSPEQIAEELFEEIPEEDRDRIRDEIKAYGREKKISGARSFAKLVKEMRQQQKRYFTTRSDEALKISKKLEAQVDRSVELVLK